MNFRQIWLQMRRYQTCMPDITTCTESFQARCQQCAHNKLIYVMVRVNSLWPSDAYIICTIAKPLSDPMLPYCQLGCKELISVEFVLSFESFQSRKCTWRCHQWIGGYFVSAPISKYVTCCCPKEDVKDCHSWYQPAHQTGKCSQQAAGYCHKSWTRIFDERADGKTYKNQGTFLSIFWQRVLDIRIEKLFATCLTLSFTLPSWYRRKTLDIETH